jgi:hypothetical protein
MITLLHTALTRVSDDVPLQIRMFEWSFAPLIKCFRMTNISNECHVETDQLRGPQI